MSMLSAQCDELRAMAESVGLAMPQAATLMMEAADTIWELRCKLSGMVDERERARVAEAENAKLREFATDLWRFTKTACKKYPRLFDPSAQGGQMVRNNMLVDFELRLRELGIEVES